jgi:pimeloyl-ACP methyl ester carboxylesterase
MRRCCGRSAPLSMRGPISASAFNDAAALKRGYHVLAFDGPDQGRALLQQGLTLRPDWGTVVTPVLDYALSRSEVDPDRVALIGLSLGGFLAPRAASTEHRVAALIADSGSFDMQATFRQRLPGPMARRYVAGSPRFRALLGRILRIQAKAPTAGWAPRRGMQVHGLTDPLAYVDSLGDYRMAGYAERITCPTWVANAEGDDIGASAPELVEALTCPKQYVSFTAAEGAGDHCESGARALYHARSFGWLDNLFHPHSSNPREAT